MPPGHHDIYFSSTTTKLPDRQFV
ncbi:unnamed protein product [Spodoptera littoralis]|uniref:Uncharacterized protein n=1 Tax=Spodoptera littoralis TaxID=7109 RepID=A0A9P0ILD2_SPOLI|nr:unnamed protein product [Spodoptera littoralis]CAH1647884.1 unnamed protein product [Spodoptera littoralis]